MTPGWTQVAGGGSLCCNLHYFCSQREGKNVAFIRNPGEQAHMGSVFGREELTPEERACVTLPAPQLPLAGVLAVQVVPKHPAGCLQRAKMLCSFGCSENAPCQACITPHGGVFKSQRASGSFHQQRV